MNSKIRIDCLMLIDDHYPTNYYNELIIKEMGCAKNLIIKSSANEALIYFDEMELQKHPRPNVIFLDINMPKMNGWQFLAAYEKIPAKFKADKIFVMTSTEGNPEYAEKEQSINVEINYCHKPLSKEMILEIINGK